MSNLRQGVPTLHRGTASRRMEGASRKLEKEKKQMQKIIHTCTHTRDKLRMWCSGAAWHTVVKRVIVEVMILFLLFFWIFYIYQRDNMQDLYDKYGNVRMETATVVKADWSGIATIYTSSGYIYKGQYPYNVTGNTVLCWIADNHTPNDTMDDKILRTQKVRE